MGDAAVNLFEAIFGGGAAEPVSQITTTNGNIGTNTVIWPTLDTSVVDTTTTGTGSFVYTGCGGSVGGTYVGGVLGSITTTMGFAAAQLRMDVVAAFSDRGITLFPEELELILSYIKRYGKTVEEEVEEWFLFLARRRIVDQPKDKE